ncbi:MAG: hypothetical protein A2268_08055 [Candidatus Raymondbacteria bacterium RifOxyA12_full_50_37]|uniref:Molecular chaperone Skp n=1 Tax=Candidatus Raymondbacteria bacterium RIFOXYD12_FULL_49_13 TaxID=1817890 RepID=A0A1F7FIF8_UNCRA|nr:MAG: hypothetical protein A2350_01440 [Candidatus Raymondbacteria bacterium RifOxyB12_full_50_8]OGJ91761.1 MAG: hypothetical protein A2268_08055 [Candidatus Raymondbacteria bacterium RifOxyA12_full_50_37]OGJ93521.1 MAG: hypothetical protein A2248_09100 [Candidatus Raymondbacteria bacterium RIFOXYA2_FULL_49_16]OGJ96987.1 MAG: hypothetical protein A2487_06030 [Candidatus Raymondbacteria bacterium RifOxyC12_full_50_8]OGJ98791.1 MAG: hypothetical protein A2453_09910 [Candidatus Raymondbacteria b
MRRLNIAVLTGIALLAFCTIVPAKNMKIGFIKSDEVFKKFKGTAEAQEKYDKEVAKWEQDAAQKEKQIKEIKEQMDKQGLLMSEAKKKEKEEEIKRLYVEYQGFVNKVFGNQGEAFKKNEEYTKPIVKKINEILTEIGKNEQFDFIFDATAGGVVFANDAYDLTDRIVKELNKGL